MSFYHNSGFTESLHKILPADLRLEMERPCRKCQKTGDEAENRYTVYARESGERVASFRAHALPGCCGVLVIYYLRPLAENPIPAFKRLVQVLLKAAGKAKYGAVLLSQVKDSAGDKVLKGLKGAFVNEFTNWKTDNALSVFMFHTAKPKEKKAAPEFDSEDD